jgi:hypothetical protein
MGTDASRTLVAGLCVAAVMLAASPGHAQETPPGRAMEDVQFEPDQGDLTLLARTGEIPVERIVRGGHGWYHERGMARRYAPVCDGPCSARFEAGEYHLALAKPGGGAVETGAIRIEGPATIRAHYEDHRAARLLGAVLGVAGTIAGAIMIAASVHPETVCDPARGGCYAHETVNGGVMGAGIGVVVGSVVLGSILGTRDDSATLAISPLPLSSPAPSHVPQEEGLLAPRPSEGALFTVRF